MTDTANFGNKTLFFFFFLQRNIKYVIYLNMKSEIKRQENGNYAKKRNQEVLVMQFCFLRQNLVWIVKKDK